MLRQDYWLFEFLTISRVIHAKRKDYYRSFRHTETDDHDLTYFLLYQLDVTYQAIEQLHRRIRDVIETEQNLNTLRATERLNERQKAVLRHAATHPGQHYTFESHMRSHGVAYQTARTD